MTLLNATERAGEFVGASTAVTWNTKDCFQFEYRKPGHKARAYGVKIDPEFRDLIPPLASAEYEALRQSLLNNRLYTDDGSYGALLFGKVEGKYVLLDGHNRYQILFDNDNAIEGFPCAEVRFPKADSERGVSRETAKLWILENQVSRRNLTDDQRAIIWNDIRERRAAAGRAEQLQQAREAKAEPGVLTVEDILPPTEPKQRTRAAVAKEAKLPERKLRAAQEIKKASPTLAAKVRAGELTLKQAKKIAQPAPKPKKPTKDLDEAGRYRKLYSFVGNLYKDVRVPAERFAEIKRHAEQLIEDFC